MMLVSREVAAAGRVNLADIRSPEKAPDSMWTGVSDAMEVLRPLHLFIDDRPALKLADVRRKALQVKRRSGDLLMVVVDYLQLMEGDGETRAQELTTVARGLKRLAKELGCVVLLLSQLEPRGRQAGRPAAHRPLGREWRHRTGGRHHRPAVARGSAQAQARQQAQGTDRVCQEQERGPLPRCSCSSTAPPSVRGCDGDQPCMSRPLQRRGGMPAIGNSSPAATIDILEQRLREWGAWLTQRGSGVGYPAMSVIHPNWMPPTPGQSADAEGGAGQRRARANAAQAHPEPERAHAGHAGGGVRQADVGGRPGGGAGLPGVDGAGAGGGGQAAVGVLARPIAQGFYQLSEVGTVQARWKFLRSRSKSLTSAPPPQGARGSFWPADNMAREYHHLYNRRAWKQLREAQLAAAPLCRMHQAIGQLVPAEVVDHITPHKGDLSRFYDPANLQSLCKRCHDGHKQAQEANADGLLRGAGHDGKPLDLAHPRHHDPATQGRG